MGRLAYGHENDRLEAELGMPLLGAYEVTDMGRVEDAAEDAEPQSRYGRTWPEPSTTYL